MQIDGEEVNVTERGVRPTTRASRAEEVDDVGLRALFGGSPTIPLLQHARDPARILVGERVRNDEHAGMGLACLEEVSGEADEVVAIAGDQNTSLEGGEAELGAIGEGDARSLDLVNGHDIQIQGPSRLGHRRMDILIQQVSERHSGPLASRFGEGQLASYALRGPLALTL